MRCPGSVKLSQQCPVPDTSVYAAQGTVAHEIAATLLSEGKWLTDQHENLLESVYEQDGFEIEVDQEMLEGVKLYVNTVLDDAADEFVNPSEIMVETQFSLEHLHKDAFGTCDAVFCTGTGGVLYVYDFKYGAGIPVDVSNNKQLTYYALGALKAIGVVPNEVELVIIQPRAKHDDGPVRRYRTNIGRVLSFEYWLQDAMEKTDLPVTTPGLLKPGDWCRFCQAKPICPALKNQARSLAFEQFGLSHSSTPPEPEKLTVEQLAEVMKQAKVIQDWVDSVFNFAYAAATSGVKIPGMKLVQKKAHRKWKSDDEFVNEYRGLLGDKLYEKKLVSPAKAEKLLDKDGKEALKSFWHVPDNGLTLVHDWDKRVEVSVSATEDFKDVLELSQ